MLKHVAEVATHIPNGRRTLMRIGGEELGIALPGCGLDEARAITDAVRHAVDDSHLIVDERALYMTISARMVDGDDAELAAPARGGGAPW